MSNTDSFIVDTQQACVQSSTILGVMQRNGVSLPGLPLRMAGFVENSLLKSGFSCYLHYDLLTDPREEICENMPIHQRNGLSQRVQVRISPFNDARHSGELRVASLPLTGSCKSCSTDRSRIMV
jgi:hypothetical protein